MKKYCVLILCAALALTACSDDPEPNGDNNANNTNNTAPDTDTPDAEPDTTNNDTNGSELTVQSILPVEGDAAGGEEVTVSGTGFVDGATVFFGDTEAATTFVSSTQLDATTPQSAPGTVDVRVETPDGESATLADAFEFIPSATALEIGWCTVQHPAATTTETDTATEEIFGRVFAENCTEGDARCEEVNAEIGWGDAAVDPSASPDDWSWQNAEYNADHTSDDNDEYTATITPDAAGSFGYAFRFSVEGGDWTYCDLDGSDNGFDTEQAGELTVEDAPSVSIDWCNLQYPESTTTTAGEETEMIFGRVYSQDCTGPDAQCEGISAELGVGPTDADPSDDAATFDWTEATYNAGHTADNNDEYQATLTPDTEGTYSYAYRFSGDGGATWTYCDLDGTDNDFQTDQQGTLTVEP